MNPVFFPTPRAWRAWLEKHHAAKQELLVGFYKRASGQPSITWPESVDGALCFGWIDGVRRRIDDVSYSIRFTPRRPRSIWSNVNIRRAQELIALGLMHPAGVSAFEARHQDRSGIYAFEQEEIAFHPEQTRQLQAVTAAAEYFRSQPPSYRKAATWWVISAKREVTKAKRLAELIEYSAKGRRLRQFTLEARTLTDTNE